MSIQAKLLRVLQERSMSALANLETRKADVRIISGHQYRPRSGDKAGRFREDLFYRLDVVEIVIPPLRDRREDILPASRGAFWRSLPDRTTGKSWDFQRKRREALINYEWPGNVRELRNAIERAVLLCKEDRVGIHHFPLKLKPSERQPGRGRSW